MSSRNYETQILDSIQMIVDNAISKADFDKTIKAVINEASNSADGKYIVSYQGSLLVAYSSNLDVHYTKGMEVYVLIPGNDSSQRKTIIGAVDNYGLDYTSLLEGDASYDTIGKNIVNSDKTFELCSYNKEETKILYHRDNNINAIGYNSEDFETYIKNAEYLICGATFKTALPLEQQLQGDYGIAFDIDYKIDNETITKTYIVNTSKMIGAPYSLATDTRQYEIFNIDTNNILSVKQIYIFAYNFPNIEAGQPNDIFVSKIELLAAAKITEEELNSIALSIITPQGTYFNTQDTDEAIRNMEAQIKIKGRILNSTEDVKYYWFRENSLISNNHRLYNRLSGAGWECLNEFNASGVDFMTVEWVPGSSSFSTTKNQNVAKETKYKCIAIYNKDTVLQKDFTITNYDSDYEISILSNQGTQFYHNNGKPTLTCYINGVEDKSDEYLYVWSSIDNNNTFNSLVETTIINDEYNTAKAGYDALIKEIEEEKKLVAATQDQLTEYNNIIEKYEYATRVEKNIVWNIDLRTISFFKTFKCSVFKNSVFIGTASVVITNDLTTNLNYTLVINNGNQVFKYNEAGVAPNSSSLKNPIEILPLSFTLYDKDGKEVDQSTIESNNVFWTLPLIHTLVKTSSLYQNVFEETEEYVTYYGYKDLNFDISNQYSISKSNNDIDLKVIYQGQTITAKTNLTFTKTGEVGTNGTDYMCKIVPNVANGTVLNIDPTVILNEATQTYELSYPVAENNIWFKLQLWKNGELVFNDNQSGYSEEGSEVKLEWSMLKNNYGQKNVDKSNFNVNKDTGEFSVDVTKYNNPANIVKCAVKYNGVEYFATMPIITARIKNFNYDISLTKDSGFREVIYSSDGRYPSYDDRKPFEIQVKEKINEKFEDISLLTKDYAVDYEWSTKGEVYYSYWQSVSNLKIKKLYVSKEKRNQKYFEPKESYNGLAVNNAIECLVSRNKETLCSIHIPIYCYLNRYGNAAINGWDGNSISIDKDNSGMILAPQIGAGSKNDDNSFTGIFMGSVKAQGEIKEEHGLFGYNAGQRTIALNAADGSARFGIEGKGQIVLDPATGDAILTSGNYSEEAGTGMEINLSKPSIKFGSGKFGVNSNGQVFADGFATTEYVDGEVKKVNETIEKIEGAAKVLEVQLNTNTITIPCTADYIPLESKTYKINYTVLFCGRDVEDDYSITVREEITKGLGMNLSTLGEISISTYKTQGVEKDISDFTFDFTYIDGFDTYTIEKKISVVLAPQGKDGKDGEPGKDGQDAEVPVAIKDCEGTKLVIEDGKKIIDFRIDGKSAQEIRTGIQRFKEQGLATTHSNTAFWNSENSVLDSFIYPMENGWAKFKANNSGTSDTIYNFIINKAALDIKANTQYTLVLEFRNLININSTAYFNPIGDDPNASLFTSVKNMQINTITEGMHKYLITSKSDISQSTQASYLYLQPGESCEFECRMSILEGNYTNTNYVYELYGITPTPDYPAEIKSIGYENLWNLNTKFTNDTTSTKWALSDTAVSIPAGTYTLSSKIIGSDSFTFNYKYANNLDHYITINGKANITFTEEVKKVAILLNANSSISDIQLEKGLIAHSNIPYGKIGIEVVNESKNKFDVEKAKINSNYISNPNVGNNTNWKVIVIELLPNTTYTITRYANNVATNSSYNLQFYLYETPNTPLYYINNAAAESVMNRKTITFTTGESGKIYLAHLYGNDERLNTLFNNIKIQIEEGLESTEYEPYFKNSTVFLLNEPLRSLPNGVKDVAYLQNGKLHIERRVGKVVFNGTETWSYDAQGSAGDTTVYGAKTLVSNYIGNDKFVTDIGNINLQANKFKITHTFSKSAEGMNGGWGKYIYVKLFATRLSTLSDSAVKTFFAENNTEVIYELDTLTIEEYDPIYTIPMHEEETDIYYVNDRLTPNVYCKYYTIYAGQEGAPGKDAEEPITIKEVKGKEIVVKDGKQAINYIIEGKSEQRTRSGINQLMPFTYGETDYFNFITNEYKSDTEYWKAVPIEDNWIHVECDLTGITESVNKYVNFFRWRSSVPNIKPSTQYTLVYEFRNVNITTMKWGISLGNTHTDVGDDVFKDGLGISPTTIKNEETKKFLTTTYDTIGDNVALSLRDFHSLANGDKFSYDLRVSVLEGDYTNKEYVYEEFGAAPTPTYKSKIQSVGYENYFDYANENNYYAIGQPLKLTKIDNGIRAYYNAGTNYVWGTYLLKDIQKMLGKTLTLSYIATPNSTNEPAVRVYWWDLSSNTYKTMITAFKNTNGGKFIVPGTMPGDNYCIALFFYANYEAAATGECYVDYTDIQLEEGTIAHPYVPYGKTGIEIVQHGKNYLENIAHTETQSGIGYTVNQDKTVIAKGTATTQHVQNLSGLIKNTFGGKYLVGAPVGSSSASYCLIASYYDENNTWKTEQYDTGNGLLIKSDYPIIRIGILFRNGISADNIVFKPMIIDDLADNKYEQYSWVSTVLSINEPLRSVSNGAKDIAKIENGKLIIERNIKSLIFTGAATENWSAFATETEKSIGFYYTDNNILGTFGHPTFTDHGYCSHFPMGVTSYTPTDEERFGLIPSSQPPYISFRIFKETASTLSEWKTWLSNNPVEVIVESVAPILEEYDLPYYIPMFEDNTNIYYTHDNLEPEMSCKYYTPFAGVNGQTIESIEEEFYLSTSKTSQVGGSWTSKAPTWSTGKYMWTRSKIIYTNPYAIAYTTPICDNSWEAVNELQIGGRNILYNSSFSENFDRWGNESKCPIVTKNGFKCAHIQHTELKKSKVVTQSILGRLEPNTYYTMSGWVLTENIKLGSTNPTCMFYHDGEYNDNGTSRWYGYGSASIHISDKPGVWNFIKWTFKVTEPYCSNATKSVIYIHTRDFTGDVYFRNLKLEKGSVVTDWTPAPEDTITDLAGLQTQIDGKIQSYSQTSDPSSSWTTTELKTQHSGDLWYNPGTKKTQRWSGTAWVNLENAEAQEAARLAGLKAQVFTVQPTPPYYKGDLWITSLKNKAGIVKTCKETRTSGSYVSTDWVEGLKYTDDSTVNNLKIGGRNLALKTNQGLTYWGWSTSDGVITKEEYIDPDDGVKGVKFTCTTASTSWSFIHYSLPKSQIQLLEPKTEYTISFDIKSNLGVRNTYMQIQQGNATNGLTNQGLYQIKGNETWEHAVYKITTKDSLSGLDLNSQLLYFTGTNKIGYVIIKNLKLEKGNVATAWTPAPEDTSAQVTEQIQGLDTNGRNFILKSQNEQAATLTTAGGQAYIDYDFSNILKTLTEYKTFTISADIKGTAANMTFDFYFRNSSEISFTSPINYWQVGTELKRYSQVITVNSGSTVADIDKLRFRLNSVGTVSLFNVKLEVGEKSTIWTPAPEDAIKKMTIYYTISSSKDQIRDEKGNLITNINWGTTAQATEKMPYIWQMTQIEYIEGAAQDGTPICITAMERYATKNSLQYLASDHAKVTDADKASNKWSYTRPKLSLDTPYMLIRTEIVWSNAPDKPEYINYYCDEDAYTLQKDINNRADTIVNDLETGYVKIYKNQIVVSSQEWTKEAMIAQKLPNTFSAIIIGNQGIATYKRQNEDNSLNAWPTWDEEAQRWAGNFNSVWGTDGTIDAQAVNVKNVKAESIISGILTLTNKNADGKIYIKDENGFTTVEATGDGVIISLTGANNAGGRIEITADKGFRAIDKGGMVSFGSSADNSTFEMSQAKVIKYIDFGEHLRGIVFPTDSSSTTHKGLGFIRK